MKKILGLIAIISFLGLSDLSAQCIYGNCYDGNGTWRFDNGDLYDGLWVKGKPNGQGKYTWKNGDFYRGNWVDGVMEGRGFYEWANGDKYVGQWSDNKMNGRGHYRWQMPGDVMNDATFEGLFEDGKMKKAEVQETGEPMYSGQHKR